MFIVRKLYVKGEGSNSCQYYKKILKIAPFFLLTALKMREQQYFGEHDIFV
jgi:hypothetical protein